MSFAGIVGVQPTFKSRWSGNPIDAQVAHLRPALLLRYIVLRYQNQPHTMAHVMLLLWRISSFASNSTSKPWEWMKITLGSATLLHCFGSSPILDLQWDVPGLQKKAGEELFILLFFLANQALGHDFLLSICLSMPHEIVRKSCVKARYSSIVRARSRFSSISIRSRSGGTEIKQ